MFNIMALSSTAMLLGLSLAQSTASVSNTTAVLRGVRRLTNVVTDDTEQQHRVLVAEHNVFKPLSCNAACVKTSTWTTENYNVNAGAVVIPCGHCITMDIDATDSLELPKGLDIVGRLDFLADTYKDKTLTIVTPFVRVQGKLHMRADKNAVTGEPNVKFLLTDASSGGPSAPTSFVPPGDNKFACSPGTSGTPKSCEVGNKAFVVAGGQLDIQGLAPKCKTWVNLNDVVVTVGGKLPTPSKYTKLPVADSSHPNVNCRDNSTPMVQQSFAPVSSHLDEWSGWKGTSSAIVDGALIVSNRQRQQNGPALDLARFRDCLIPGQTYLLSARVKFSGAPGSPTTCASTGDYCLSLKSSSKFASGALTKNKGKESSSDQYKYGEWNAFYTSVTFDSDELEANPIYHSLVLSGPESEIDIEIDDVKFGLPSANVLPNPSNVCGGNLIMNGDASASDMDPYPMGVLGGRVSVESGYFRISMRTSQRDSIINFLDAPGCIVPGGVYKISAKVRVRDATSPVASSIVLKSNFQNGSSSKLVVANCPASQGTWIDCVSTFTVALDFDADQVDQIRMAFETETGSLNDFDVDDWSLEFVQEAQPEIIVQAEGVQGCWGKGAEILITSHTTDFESAQRRRIVASPEPYANGFLRLTLDEAIIPPVTEKDGDGFAVEVALLSRNILFEGATDNSDDKLGGHLIVFLTPDVQQLLDGVEVMNFGRQGELGRYSIHFHLCGSVAGSVVSRNCIRESKQRCIVAHGTHGMTVSSNVAFETMGHCYMTEDGGELDNKFIGNLGASTRAASRLVRPFETDKSNPSTFWCTNPANEWIANVAAGSEANGFWFELNGEVRPPTSLMSLSEGMVPRVLALQRFADNVAHSNRKHGLRTYPGGGFSPPVQAIFENTRSYKNKQVGIFFHNSQDLKILGGVLADNEIQADFDRADDIEIDGTSVIGSTGRFNEIISAEGGNIGHSDRIIGLQLHGFAVNAARGGATVRNVRFSGFSDTLSSRAALIEIDDNVRSGHFDYWTTIEGVSVAGGTPPMAFDFRRAEANGNIDIVLTDRDSSMKPAGSSSVGPSSIISNSPQMTAFIDTAECDDFSNSFGYMYCFDVCFRTVTFATSPAETQDLVLRVSDKSDAAKTVDLPGLYYNEYGYEGTTGDIKKRRYFAAALPAGNYKAEFIDKQFRAAWPTFVEKTVESTLCVPADAVELTVPVANPNECAQLIQNGDMEESASSFPHWLHHETEVEILGNGGVSGTNAIADTVYDDDSAYIGQFLDTRCLEVGNQYNVEAWIKLKNPTSGEAFICDQGASSCPSIQLRARSSEDPAGGYFAEFRVPVVSDFVRPLANGYNLLQGTITIDSSIAAAASVSLVVLRGRKGVKLYLDNVSMKPLTASCNDDLVRNGDMSEQSTHWEKGARNTDNSELAVLQFSDDRALRLITTSSSDTIDQSIRTGCISEKERYLASAQLRILEADSKTSKECDRGVRSGPNACPRMKLKSFVGQNSMTHDGGAIAEVDYGVTADGWFTMSGVFSGTNFDEQSEKSILSIGGSKEIAIDNVSITFLPQDCSELLLNGDAEDGETVRFWTTYFGALIQLVPNGNGSMFKVSDRGDNVADGIVQRVDPRCLERAGEILIFSVDMAVVSKANGNAALCDPSKTNQSSGCPPIRVLGFKDGTRVVNDKIYMAKIGQGQGGLDTYQVEVKVSTILAGCDSISFGIRSYNIAWDLLVDNLSLTPA